MKFGGHALTLLGILNNGLSIRGHCHNILLLVLRFSNLGIIGISQSSTVHEENFKLNLHILIILKAKTLFYY